MGLACKFTTYNFMVVLPTEIMYNTQYMPMIISYLYNWYHLSIMGNNVSGAACVVLSNKAKAIFINLRLPSSCLQIHVAAIESHRARGKFPHQTHAFR